METDIRNLWLMTCTGLVFFMQAGFCCLEAGSVRAKNSINVALKNVVTFLVAGFCFYVVAYSLMFGKDGITGIVGLPVYFLRGADDSESFPFLYQMMFCSTAATIVSGAMAERLRFLPYILGTGGLSLIVYPLYGHWAWNSGGWLHRLGFHDFAGSSAVHMIGGFVSLAGITKLGARLGRFNEKGETVEVHASNVPLVALGTFILYFGWIGFNGGSAPFGPQTGTIILNTILGGVFGGLACLLFAWAMQGISGAATIMNGLLAGLVAITASADVVTPAAASLIGCVGGLTYFFAEKVLIRLKIDDAVSAVPVHAFAGLAGILMTGLLAKESYLTATSQELGIHLTRSSFFLTQILGACVCATWAFVMGYIMWMVVGRISRLRVSADEEIVGLNYSEHQVRSQLDEMVGYMAARAANSDIVIRPNDIDAGEFARLVSVVETWSQRLIQDREEIEQVRGWLNQDSDQIYALIQRCHEENNLQTQRLEVVARKIEKVEKDLRMRAPGQASTSILADEVLESVREKLVEMQTGSTNMNYYWDQLRNLGSSLFRNTRTLQRGTAPAIASASSPAGGH